MRRALLVAALVETVSLLVLLANLATAHIDAVTSLIGPVHGTAYLISIAITFMSTRRRRPRLLAAVPAVGGLLAARTINHRTPPGESTTPDDRTLESTSGGDDR